MRQDGPAAAAYAVEKLSPRHDTASFDCGQGQLNRFLSRYGLSNQAAGGAQTYVAARGPVVAGFYSLAAGSVTRDQVPGRIARGLARHPVPVMILARLAVDRREQNKGLGKALLKDALKRTAQAADIIGIRAVLVTAKDARARAFYEHFNFDPGPVDAFQLFLLLKDVQRLIGK